MARYSYVLTFGHGRRKRIRRLRGVAFRRLGPALRAARLLEKVFQEPVRVVRVHRYLGGGACGFRTRRPARGWADGWQEWSLA